MDDEPAYDITITSEGDTAVPAAARLIESIKAALRRHESTSARINLALVNDDVMAELNQKHRRHEGPTDVLTFDLRDDGLEAGTDARQVDGEIVVSVDTAAREAADHGHTEEAELALYAVHGTLHLLGYDDAGEAESAEMHKMEDEILSSVGFGYVYDRERT